MYKELDLNSQEISFFLLLIKEVHNYFQFSIMSKETTDKIIHYVDTKIRKSIYYYLQELVKFEVVPNYESRNYSINILPKSIED